METKPCIKCGSTDRQKPGPGRKFGNCKVCAKARDKKWYQANLKETKARNKTWRQNNSDRYRARNEAWAKKNPDKRQAIIKTYREANPEKFAAHKAVEKAVRRGDLPRVSTCDCRDCGIQATEYHHEDYSKPLDVEPLCKKCHTKRHNPDN